ncbi:uncharacterized protein VP01_397g1 [Puccinia sorghi]|uniref:Uncharacterized protein n=1 Tax=Puccinia sorghi TaxID=27349 RepID=A0A0L6UU57_9BASI|nr:uncharacterized protein VP01_397g1 [Puccinia sorghi]
MSHMFSTLHWAEDQTNYQGLLTGGPATGSASPNWQRTDPPPHVPNQSDIALLVMEMRAQCEVEQVCRGHEETRAARKADLEEQTRVTSIVAAVAKCEQT